MVEHEPDEIEEAIKPIFESAKAGGRRAELIDNTSLDPSQARQLAERLVILLDLEKQCHVCGMSFDTKTVLESRGLGLIGANGASAIAHNECYQQVIVNHPELETILGRSVSSWSDEEKQRWSSAFSSMIPDSLFEKLFTEKK